MSKAKTKIAFIEEEDSEANELANKYQQKTDKQHILDNPDTYIGSIENVDADMWIMNDTGDRIIEKNIKYEEEEKRIAEEEISGKELAEFEAEVEPDV